MSVEKVSLSLDREIVGKARQIAGRRGLSALVNDALRVRLHQERLRRLLDEMDREFGPVGPEEIENARKAWPDDVPPKKGKSRRSA
jgi:Arc/MetJ family transcription regulator